MASTCNTSESVGFLCAANLWSILHYFGSHYFVPGRDHASQKWPKLPLELPQWYSYFFLIIWRGVVSALESDIINSHWLFQYMEPDICILLSLHLTCQRSTNLFVLLDFAKFLSSMCRILFIHRMLDLSSLSSKLHVLTSSFRYCATIYQCFYICLSNQCPFAKCTNLFNLVKIVRVWQLNK